MSRGKYSVRAYEDHSDLSFNAKGEKPEVIDCSSTEFIPELHSSGFDKDGCDSYGYTCYDKAGVYVGDGQGVDRAGWTESDYLHLRDIPAEHRDSFYYYHD